MLVSGWREHGEITAKNGCLMKKKILFIENNDNFRISNAKLLRLKGYDVTEAPTLEAAEDLLKQFFFHMLICDLRMRDDDDKLDITGLELARDSSFRGIPKIILTAYAEKEFVKNALETDPGLLPPAVRVLEKDGPPVERLRDIEKAFQQYCDVNWDLTISSKPSHSFNMNQLGVTLFPDLSDNLRAARVDELEFLLAKQFKSASSLQLGDACWRHDGLLALTLSSYSKDSPQESLLAVCGPLASIKEEHDAYEKFSPKIRQYTPSLYGHVEGNHLGLLVYAVGHVNLTKVSTLARVYPFAESKTVEAMLGALFSKSLAEWRNKEKKVSDDNQSLGFYHREKLKLDRKANQTNLAEKVAFLQKNAALLGLEITRENDKVQIAFSGQKYLYSDPLAFFAEELMDLPVVLTNTPGDLSLDTILCDEDLNVCMTRFSDAGFAPELWNHTSLEASLRFNGLSEVGLIHDLESALNGSDLIQINPSDKESAIQKPLRAILAIRRYAEDSISNDARPYHLGIFYQAIARMASFEIQRQRHDVDVSRLFHLYLAAAMTSTLLQGINEPSEKGLFVDPKDHSVIVDGERKTLRKNRFKLMVYLNERSPNFCSRQELGEHLWGPKFDATVSKDITRLNTNINRLRDDIGDNAKNPKYLLTEEGGYRLVKG